ncbi:helix-turn-helix domain-containing protein [Jeotgalibacillus proteolyticus]|uniref:Transcriptional regulator n=1 Tax=Jeotgalibacillus proteolyticus TaxID=2082395 RepID=A0A2S5G8H3_9BACL|nr:helix-turn-helix transcriptional regulator [Jeotgalibacillus proteolyticus]PPA69233.1 transcriptional regulator [Jeotgalibacillus proteolyticus]
MIGKNIIAIRKEKGFTLSELAERAGVSKSYLSNIERNLKQNPSIQVMEKIAHVLDVELKVLLDVSTDPAATEDREWTLFVKDLKENLTSKEQLHEYKLILEFVRWRQQQEEHS